MRDLTPERLTRLLALLTYLGDGRAVSFAEVTRHFGITEAQLLDDINTLWVAGAPGYTHTDLIDFEATAMDAGVIQLRDSQNMDKPLRLSPTEGVTLLVALNSLIASLGDDPILESTRKKLSAAAGQAAVAAEAIQIERSVSQTRKLQQELTGAITSGKQVWIRYVSGNDEVTERNIEPIRLQAIEDHWVLDAWCHRAQDSRQFRLDRILESETLETQVTKDHPLPTRLDPKSFHHRATLSLTSAARWVTEQIPVEEVFENDEGFTAVIGASDPVWLENLCLRLGDTLLAIEPPELANAVSIRAKQALEMYEPGVG